MGFCTRAITAIGGPTRPPRQPGLRDRLPPWRRCRLRVHCGAVLCWFHTFAPTGRHRFQRRRQQVEAAHRRIPYQPAPQRGEDQWLDTRTCALEAPRALRANLQPCHPLGGARAGAASAMRSLPAARGRGRVVAAPAGAWWRRTRAGGHRGGGGSGGRRAYALLANVPSVQVSFPNYPFDKAAGQGYSLRHRMGPQP